MSAARKEFTTFEGLVIQREQLEKWKLLLKHEVYTALEAWATQYNEHPLVKDGYDICRGSELDNFIANFFNKRTEIQNFSYKHNLYEQHTAAKV